MTALLIVAAWCSLAFLFGVLFGKVADRNQSLPLFTDFSDTAAGGEFENGLPGPAASTDVGTRQANPNPK